MREPLPIHHTDKFAAWLTYIVMAGLFTTIILALTNAQSKGPEMVEPTQSSDLECMPEQGSVEVKGASILKQPQ